jgi:hypothetical protein
MPTHLSQHYHRIVHGITNASSGSLKFYFPFVAWIVQKAVCLNYCGLFLLGLIYPLLKKSFPLLPYSKIAGLHLHIERLSINHYNFSVRNCLMISLILVAYSNQLLCL